jgi:hypothetical protein
MLASRTIESQSLLLMTGKADKTTMKRVTAITAAIVLTCASWASAQGSMSKPLADVAKTEEARRTQVRKPARVITNKDLRPDISKGVGNPTTITPVTDATNATPATTTPGAAPATSAEAAKDQAFWAGRMKEARDKLSRSQLFADSLQTRINSLTTDFVNRDDPAQRAKIETDRQTALAELEKVKKDIQEQSKAVTAIQDEARRAGVPASWVR